LRVASSAYVPAVAIALTIFTVASVPAPSMPHPAPNVRARPVDNAACEGCHAGIAAEWRQSLHHASFTDRDFQRAIAHEPDPFCLGCHAPERDAALGVACVTCHVTSADVLAVPGTARAPHALTRTPQLASEAACARCHEFDFPDARLRQKPLAMQRTITEHRGRTDTCASCHMTKKGGHADHRFAASRDEAFVRSAVTVRATRLSPRAVEVVLAPAHVGHAFPTGDLFRRVRVSVGTTSRFLARHYASRQEIPSVVVRSEIGDDRVQGGERVVVFEAQPEQTRVRAVYERADGPSDPPGANVHVSGSIVLFDEEL
jgi:hypothetical protein